MFTPHLGRFIVTEVWSAALSVSFSGALLYTLGTMRQAWLVGAFAFCLSSVVFAATVMRRSRRIVIGDTWMTGPTPGSTKSITIQFGTMDRERSGVTRRRIQIQSISGREITAKTAWYSLMDREEIKRLIRDRSGAETLKMTGTS